MQKSCHLEKTVQITLYVVNPGKTKHASSQARPAARRHHKLRNSDGGYDRKAQLLLYSRELRAVACRKQPPMIHKPQPKNKVKEAIQIAFSHKSQPQKKVKEATQIESSPKVAEALLQIAASHRPQHGEKKSVQSSSSVISKPNVMVAQQINRTSAWKVVPVGQKPAQAKLPQPPPPCFGDWKKIIFPELLMRTFGGRRINGEKIKKKRTLSTSLSNKMNAIVMSSMMEKERVGVMAKFLSAMGKLS